jgi:hypothetical protein
MILKKIGYFDQALGAFDVVAPKVEYPKQKIVSYLRSGMEIFSWLEDVRCMYGCANLNVGFVEFTDGVWVWTREFIHYVDCHGIAIPENFLNFLKDRSYTFEPNESIKIRRLHNNPSELEQTIQYSDDVWMEWVAKNVITAKKMEAEPQSLSKPNKAKFDLPDDW